MTNEIFIIDKPDDFECPDCECTECQCANITYVHKTAKQLVQEQEDRNSTGYWNDIRTARN